jgi:hypothetical protein
MKTEIVPYFSLFDLFALKRKEERERAKGVKHRLRLVVWKKEGLFHIRSAVFSCFQLFNIIYLFPYVLSHLFIHIVCIEIINNFTSGTPAFPNTVVALSAFNWFLFNFRHKFLFTDLQSKCASSFCWGCFKSMKFRSAAYSGRWGKHIHRGVSGLEWECAKVFRVAGTSQPTTVLLFRPSSSLAPFEYTDVNNLP